MFCPYAAHLADEAGLIGGGHASLPCLPGESNLRFAWRVSQEGLVCPRGLRAFRDGAELLVV
jgi:hypothetical protein